MSKRVSIGDRRRREEERKGIDAIVQDTAAGEDAGSSAVKPRLEKVTLYVRPDQVMKIEEIQLAERRRTGKRPDKSDLVQEALDLLIQKYSNTSSSS
jgi:hypothetical protein